MGYNLLDETHGLNELTYYVTSLEYSVLKTANTYDWIIATADSRTNKAIWVISKIYTNIIDIDGPVFPSNVISKCPAIIFAVNRTASVPGRMIFLIVSMQTINGIRIDGVPCGTKWANMCCVWFNHPYIMKHNHIGNANVNVVVKCLVLVKIYGNKPIKLLNKIIENIEIKIKVLPLCPV